MFAAAAVKSSPHSRSSLLQLYHEYVTVVGTPLNNPSFVDSEHTRVPFTASSCMLIRAINTIPVNVTHVLPTITI